MLRAYAKVFLLTFAVVLPVSVALALMLSTTQALFSFYEELVPLGKNEIAVTSYSIGPFTAMLDLNRTLREVGANFSAYELMTVAEYNGNPLIVRGILPIKEKYGSEVESISRCESCCIIGKSASEKLKVGRGDIALLSSPFIKEVVPVYISGITDAKPYSYELLCPIGIAQMLRGISRGYASIIYFNASSINASKVIGTEAPQGLLERAIIAMKYAGPQARLEAFRAASEAYLSSIGISKTAISALDLAVAVVLLSSLYAIGTYIPNAVKNEAKVLRIIGVSLRKIKQELFLVEAISALLSWAMTYAALRSLDLRIEILLHSLPLSIDSEPYLLSLAIALATLYIATMRCNLS